MMSHSQLLMSNQCWVLYPLHPSFLLHPGPAGLLTGLHKWIPQHCTFPVNDRTNKRHERHPFLGKVFALPLPSLALSFSPQDMPVICGTPNYDCLSKANPTAQICGDSCLKLSYCFKPGTSLSETSDLLTTAVTLMSISFPHSNPYAKIYACSANNMLKKKERKLAQCWSLQTWVVFQKSTVFVAEFSVRYSKVKVQRNETVP